MYKKQLIPFVIWGFFLAIAFVLWRVFDNIFYLFNFAYIGTFLALGIFLFSRKVKYTRNVVQMAIGLYMLIYLGILSNENMQIEGF